MYRHSCSFIILILAATLLGACGGSSDKGPAEAALRAAEEAINSAKGERAGMPGTRKGSGTRACRAPGKVQQGRLQVSFV